MTAEFSQIADFRAAAQEQAVRINALRRELGADLVIMGHHYQNDRIIAHCDRTGDSLALARQVPSIDAAHIVLCGVFFMGESAALMARPGQQVYLPEPDADCTMARMVPGKLLDAVLTRLNASGRRIVPLAYVNSSLEVKAVVGRHGGAVCTSANARPMLDWALQQGDAVLFVPDKNLGYNTAHDLGLDDAAIHIINIRKGGELVDMDSAIKARLLLWPGLCSIHARFRPEHITALRAQHPDCSIIVHPECAPELVTLANASGSTARIIEYVNALPDGSVVGVGTEINQVRRLALAHAARGLTVVPLCVSACCNMAAVTPSKLEQLLIHLRDGTARALSVPDQALAPARLTLTRMFEASA